MKRLLVLGLLAATSASAAPSGSTVSQGKHNLSVSGKGPLRAQDERRACIFCHAAHSGKPGGKNRPDSAAQYQTYRSSTMVARPSAGPTGATRTCLSCHDGTIAVGDTATKRIPMAAGSSGKLTSAQGSFGFDLTSTHPVSIAATPTAATRRPLADEAAQLDKSGQVQCTSCHDPHSEDTDPVEKNFLVGSSRNGALCTTCHTLPGWQANPSAHQASLASTRVPGYASLYPTVGENACASCHVSHGAGAVPLLKVDKGASEDSVCLGCHDGRIARLDVATEVRKPYAHSMAGGPTGHDPGEGPTSATARLPENLLSQRRHVACVDCHDPHSALARPALAPRATGPLAGAWGIDRNGLRVQPVNYEYEVCFKCHADSANQPQARGPTGIETVRRAVTDVNLRRVFGADAASSHPVLGPGRGGSIPGLLPPYSTSSIIYCGDCHASDAQALGAGAPRGPHGSTYPHLLERSYSTIDRIGESAATYALCYKCHDRATLLSGGSNFSRTSPTPGAPRQGLHQLHLTTALGPASCAACHSAHGVSAQAGNPVNNAHLIDFDVSIVSPNARGFRQYTTSGARSGSCALSCHGKNHDNLGY
ncbi:MAG TPA: cytochrome c3 family protein [Anaeromyxobacteraceae bacterium]|nr:cytochrome c3 family protein [Anaeromyxobacteraceae bacterium]